MQRYLARPARGRRDIGVRHLGGHLRPGRHAGRAGTRGRRQLPGQEPVRPVPQRPGDAPHVARVRRRQDRGRPAPARPPAGAAARRRPPRGRDRHAPSQELVGYVTDLGRRAEAIRHPGRRPGGRQHAQGLRRRPPRRPGPAPGRPAADRSRQDHRGRRPDQRDLARPPRRRVPGPGRHAVPGARVAAAGVLRPGNPRTGVERLRRAPRDAHRPRGSPRVRPVRARGEVRHRPGPPVRRVPVRARRRADRLDREDGHRNQRPGPRRRAAPPRRALAPRRRRPARKGGSSARAT